MGCIRAWDIRKSQSCLGSFDMQQSSSDIVKIALFENTVVHEWGKQMKSNKNKRKRANQEYVSTINDSIQNALKRRAIMKNSEVFITPTDKGKEINHNFAHQHGVASLCFTNDGRYLISKGYDSRIRLWDVATCSNMLVTYKGIRTKSSNILNAQRTVAAKNPK